jgi:hypothetical protein
MIREALFLLCLSCFLGANAQVIYINNTGKQTQYDSTLFYFSQKAENELTAIPVSQIRLLPSLFAQRYELNKKYLMSLENDKLLQNFYYEAGISKTGNVMLNKDINHKDFYWGWGITAESIARPFLGTLVIGSSLFVCRDKRRGSKSKSR